LRTYHADPCHAPGFIKTKSQIVLSS